MRDRSAHSLDQIAREFHAPLLSHVRRQVSDRGDAEDIVQETWARTAAATRPDGFTSVRGYLYRVARNLIIDRSRKAARNIEVAVENTELARLADSGLSPEAELITRDELRRIDSIVAGMPPRAREVFRLARIEGLSFPDIARRLGVSRQTVHENMTRALMAVQLAADADFRKRP